MANEQINTEDLDATVSNLEKGVKNLVLDRAVAEISGWQRKLQDSGEADLQEVAQELVGLRRELENGMDSSGGVNAEAVGGILAELGSRVQAVADKRGTSAGPGVEEKLKKLGGLLAIRSSAVCSPMREPRSRASEGRRRELQRSGRVNHAVSGVYKSR